MTGSTAACVAYFSAAWSCDSAVSSSPCFNVGRRERHAAADAIESARALLAVTRCRPSAGLFTERVLRDALAVGTRLTCDVPDRGS